MVRLLIKSFQIVAFGGLSLLVLGLAVFHFTMSHITAGIIVSILSAIIALPAVVSLVICILGIPCVLAVSKNIGQDMLKLFYLAICNLLFIIVTVMMPLLYMWTGHLLFAFFTVSVISAACASPIVLLILLGLAVMVYAPFSQNKSAIFRCGLTLLGTALLALICILPLLGVILGAALQGMVMGAHTWSVVLFVIASLGVPVGVVLAIYAIHWGENKISQTTLSDVASVSSIACVGPILTACESTDVIVLCDVWTKNSLVRHSIL